MTKKLLSAGLGLGLLAAGASAFAQEGAAAAAAAAASAACMSNPPMPPSSAAAMLEDASGCGRAAPSDWLSRRSRVLSHV